MKKTHLILLLLSILTSCSTSDQSHLAYQLPTETEDGLLTAGLDEVNLDSSLIIKAVNSIRQGRYGEIHSLLIYKDDRLVLETYFPGHQYKWDAPEHYGEWVNWNRDSLHCAHSVSKSVTSMCMGIAVDNGFIQDPFQPAFNYLDGYEYLNKDGKDAITIEHLLTCTSGLQWSEWNAPLSSMENDQIAIWFHEKGPVDYAFSRPLVHEPGSWFNYSGANIDALGVIIENASGLSFSEFSENYLFTPLGLKGAYWKIIYPTGEVQCCSGLCLRPRDMLKLGILMLNGGLWNGKQILPESWVEKSRRPYQPEARIDIPGEDMSDMGYSYTWWTKTIDVGGRKVNWFSANGWGGQKIIILPELNSVIVFTGGNYTRKVKEFSIMEDYILPAFKK